MTKKLLITFLCFLTATIYAQNNKVTNITYSQSVFLNIQDSTKYSKEEFSALREAMNRKAYFKLKTNSYESLYINEPRIDNQLPSGGLQVTFSNSESFIYQNFRDSISITEETYPKKFFIKEDLPNYNWVLTNVSKKYKEFEIKLATSDKNGYEINAWYTESIGVMAGPRSFWGLPGLILIVEITHQKSGEKSQILMEDISYEDLDYTLKPKLKKNRVVSREYYKKILDDHIKRENEFYRIGVDTD